MSNLKELLTNKLEIPMLQRDYAQGRSSQIKIANAFLDSIFEALKNGGNLHIDFIYGYKEGGKFLLIDGQQRITTLWLLHFYLYKQAGIFDSIKESLKNFSYNTRKSSKDFCKNLLDKDFDTKEKPSKAIRAKGGEFGKAEDLNNDPTIKAMLNMLDLIFERIKDEGDFKDEENFKQLATNLNEITFDLFDMGEFQLGEELYIKMNARGKQLSKYENLKSYIEKDSNISKDTDLLARIDNDWSDYFFDGKDIEGFDKKGCNFLHYANLFFAQKEVKDIKAYIENPNQAVSEIYKPLQDIDNIKLLDRVVELCILFDDFKITETLKIKDSSFFKEAKETLGYKDICYFFSILFFVKDKEIETIDKNALNDYLRVCRHLIENHRLDAPNDTASFFNLFDYLHKGRDNIYQFLSENPTHNFHSRIYRLEARKAELILQSRNQNCNWEEILNKTSEHKILQGWVDFLLDFSDEEFDYEEYNKKDSKELKNPNFEKFQQYSSLTMNILDTLNSHLTLFQRAFLCIGDFSFYSTNYFYGNSPVDIFRDRDALNSLLKGNKNDDKKPYFKKFLDELLKTKGENLAAKMQAIIANTDLAQKQWWEQLLIGEEGLFDFLNERKKTFQRYRRIRYFHKTKIKTTNDSDYAKIELLPKPSSTTNVRDLLDYGFYCFCKRSYKDIEYYKDITISTYDSPHEQYGSKYPLKSSFSLNNKKVLCNSIESTINFDNKEYPITLKEGVNIFDEFEKVLKLLNKV